MRPDRERGRRLDPVESLWICVLQQALIDAKALGKHGDESREEAREWLRGGEGRDKVLDLAGIEPEAFERRLPHLEAEWRRVDDKIERLRGAHRPDARPAPETANSPHLVP